MLVGTYLTRSPICIDHLQDTGIGEGIVAEVVCPSNFIDFLQPKVTHEDINNDSEDIEVAVLHFD
jgi:hypothetical protein